VADKILLEGLRRMGRQYVHLSTDLEIGQAVGKR
jgi:RNA:NAD 2'-phosphotransferase (TPT1/KptA family)